MIQGAGALGKAAIQSIEDASRLIAFLAAQIAEVHPKVRASYDVCHFSGEDVVVPVRSPCAKSVVGWCRAALLRTLAVVLMLDMAIATAPAECKRTKHSPPFAFHTPLWAHCLMVLLDGGEISALNVRTHREIR